MKKDEDGINTWLDLCVPDNASEEDYESIAEDDEAFTDICKEFLIFMRNKDNLVKNLRWCNEKLYS